MDKYEYNVKLEQIKKLIRKKDYATAARIADTIDWYKVKNNQTIVLIADVYEASGRYEQARENLKLAYDRSGLGRQIAYKLVNVERSMRRRIFMMILYPLHREIFPNICCSMNWQRQKASL